MALHDFQCRACRRLLVDHHVPAAIGARAGAPICGVCGNPMEWIPKIGRMDAKEPFQRFEVYDGRNARVTVDSLHALRRVERESEQLARNGEGQQMVFRRWSQDGSNRDVGTLGDLRGPAAHPDPAWLAKKGKALRQTEDAAHGTEYGPGVTDANTSALGGLE